jgi:transcriptional regulator with AAA-type ATPase domain
MTDSFDPSKLTVILYVNEVLSAQRLHELRDMNAKYFKSQNFIMISTQSRQTEYVFTHTNNELVNQLNSIKKELLNLMVCGDKSTLQLLSSILRKANIKYLLS